MIRILFFLIVVFALGLGFAWLADRPGDMVVTLNGYQYQVSLMVAAVAVVAVVAAAMILWWLLKAIWNSPYTISRYFRVRRRDRGYQALSTGMIAAGAGDAVLARQKNKEAAKLISSDQEPLIQLLDAQASLLEGDHDAARARFEAMVDDPEMRLLGLRGLYLEAERLGDRAVARHYAGRAAEIAPQLGWAADATLEERTGQGDWDGALKLLDGRKSARRLDRDIASRRRAVLLTAKAMEALDADPLAARNAAVEANRLAPDLVPAATTAAKALFRLNDVRKGAKLLETIWKREPTSEIADIYIHARHGDATHDRLARARKLQSLRRNHPESSLAVARAALDSGEYKVARGEAEAAIRMQPREGAFLLLADIEEAETGDQGRVRQLLAKAVRAPRDPAWVADGYVSDRWAPCSPATGKLDAFEWRAPVERLGQLIEQEPERAKEPSKPPVLAAIAATEGAAPPAPKEAAPAIPVEAPAPTAVQPATVIKEAGPEETIVVADKPASFVEKESATQDVEEVAAATSEATAAEPGPARPEPTRPEQEEALANTAPIPDDPGVDAEEIEEAPKRFRLF